MGESSEVSRRGISAVVTVNIVIACYVIGAFKENLDVDKEKPEDSPFAGSSHQEDPPPSNHRVLLQSQKIKSIL